MITPCNLIAAAETKCPKPDYPPSIKELVLLLKEAGKKNKRQAIQLNAYTKTKAHGTVVARHALFTFST